MPGNSETTPAARQVSDAPSPRRLLSTAKVYEGRIWDVVSDSFKLTDDGEALVRDYIDHPGAVAVLPMNDAGEVLLIKQYRHPVGMDLWEIPAGNMAQKSDNPKIVAVGKAIAAQHVVLDKLDIAAAKKLGMELPNEPNGDQQGWLAEMRDAKTSAQFDQIFVDRLRAAHGKIFPAIATIRASTRNDSVRKLAQEANQFVLTHITLLESSGIVDYGALPSAPPPAATNKGPVPVDGNMLAAASTGGSGPGVNTSVILLVLAAALVAGVITTMRIFRSR